MYDTAIGSGSSPLRAANGNCLQCHVSDTEPACGVSDLKKAGAWKLRDYRRWSKQAEVSSAQQGRLDGEYYEGVER